MLFVHIGDKKKKEEKMDLNFLSGSAVGSGREMRTGRGKRKEEESGK